MNYITRDVFKLDEEKAKKLSKLIDKNEKLPKDTFELLAQEILNDKSQQFLTLINSSNFEEFTTILQQTKEEHEGLREIKSVIESLEKLGITNARFDQTLMRGFDYYTGIVFEVFDKNPLNRRSVFGGGRYDDLLSLFGGDKVPAFGFGAGDVVARDLMETYGKIDKNNEPSSADIYLCLLSKDVAEFAQDLAQDIRNKGKRVAIDFSFRKIGDQIKNADKMNIPDIICIGEEEVKTGKLKIKNLKTGNEEDYV
jgi:histidyl-tRNA synthetase